LKLSLRREESKKYNNNNKKKKKKKKKNSIPYHLCAEPTATRPITDTAQCRYK
jgi:hypothetical protein